MRILVTGSSGLVGARLCEALRSADIDVIPFDIRHDGADIRDEDAVRSAMTGCDGVVHLAAVSRVAWGESDPDLCEDVNVNGTRIVADAALSAVRRPWFILASSREVYGSLETLPARETDRLLPVNVYGRSKLACERIVERAQRRGLRVAILRLSNVYGALNDHPDRAVPSLVWRALKGQDLTISGAETFFDFVHVDDCVRGFRRIIDRLECEIPVPAMHLVSGVSTSLAQLAEEVLRVSGSASGLFILPARSFDVPGFVGDPSLARVLLGWRAEIPLGEGLMRLRDDLIMRDSQMDEVTMPPPGYATFARGAIGIEATDRAG